MKKQIDRLVLTEDKAYVDGEETELKTGLLRVSTAPHASIDVPLHKAMDMVKRLNNETFLQQYAAGHFCTEPLPDSFTKWSDEKLNAWLEDHAWQPFENADGKAIWEHIDNMAHSLKYMFN